MPSRRHALLAAASLPAAVSAAPETSGTPGAWPPAHEIQRRVAEVTAVELRFAARMAARDAAGFRRLLAPDVIFANGRQPLQGPDAVMAVWGRYFEGPQAPFAWKPDLVLVLPSGELAQSSGPVSNPEGRVIARFQSVWRRKAAGDWEIVFDQGAEVCAPGAP